MKKFFVMALAALSFMVAAQTTNNDVKYIDVSKLTTEQKAQIMAQTAKLEQQKDASISEQARTEISKWSELGVGMGRAAVSAAKEIGIAANDFVATPLGKVTMAIIVYKIVGQDILAMLTGGSILIVMLTIAIILVFKRKGTVEYENIPVLGGVWVKRRVKHYRMNDEVALPHFIAAGVCTIIGLVIGLNILF